MRYGPKPSGIDLCSFELWCTEIYRSELYSAELFSTERSNKGQQQLLCSSHGFTLIELLMTLLLVSVLTWTGAFSVNRFFGNPSPERAAREFVLILRRIASEAARERRDRTIICNRANNHFEELIERNETFHQTHTEVLLSLPRGIRIMECSFGSLSKQKNLIIVRKSGTVTPGHVQIENEAGKACIITQAIRGNQRIECE